MSIEKSDLIVAFENSNRNRYLKLFDYYQAWFTDSTYLSIDITRKINAELRTSIANDSIRYIRSKIMRKRLMEKSKSGNHISPSAENIALENIEKSTTSSPQNFEFKEPKSINHNQEIVTIRKSQYETD
ncbi:MAG: hypothetical protein MUF58_10005 [Arcicella sp.]|jgi:hypothetical protein|nr:hypothetical protein [Arcicella sp.]